MVWNEAIINNVIDCNFIDNRKVARLLLWQIFSFQNLHHLKNTEDSQHMDSVSLTSVWIVFFFCEFDGKIDVMLYVD